VKGEFMDIVCLAIVAVLFAITIGMARTFEKL
jgi:hypothetical protein